MQQELRSGTMLKDNGRFGFVKQDNGEEDMFVLPTDCQAFGNGAVLPPVGSRLVYIVVPDVKTGKMRAAQVQPEAGVGAVGPAGVPAAMNNHSGERTGTMLKDNGKFGFIKQDSGEEDMFVMPLCCEGFAGALPPLGARVVYGVVIDEKTRRPRAANCRPLVETPQFVEAGFPQFQQMSDLAFQAEQVYAPAVEERTGVMLKDNGNFGFIKQDTGEEDMFVLPADCRAFGGVCPPVGCRVAYTLVVDGRTGRPRAENVTPLGDGSEHGGFTEDLSAEVAAIADMEAAMHAGSPHGMMAMQASTTPISGERSGTFLKNSGNFGFIRQDCGEEDMFVMPASCGGELPQVGTRLLYEVVVDVKTGRPRAENVRLESAGGAPSYTPRPSVPDVRQHVAPWDQTAFRSPPAMQALAGPVNDSRRQTMPAPYESAATGGMERTGTMLKDNGNFGFIQQDCGEADMFIMPASCQAFGGLPPIGTRLVYTVVTDAKTGKLRAENVQPEAYLAPPQQHAAYFAPQAGPALAAPTGGMGSNDRTGTMLKDNGKFGFVKQDNGEDDMFVLPNECAAFGNVCPPPGTRVIFGVVMDAKTGRPRAENVRPLDGPDFGGGRPMPMTTFGAPGGYGAVRSGKAPHGKGGHPY